MLIVEGVCDCVQVVILVSVYLLVFDQIFGIFVIDGLYIVIVYLIDWIGNCIGIVLDIFGLVFVSLDDKYIVIEGVIYFFGIQVLVCLLMLQQICDCVMGFNMVGFILGYCGLFLGGLDEVFWYVQLYFVVYCVKFQFGVNEDMVVIVVWGM